MSIAARVTDAIAVPQRHRGSARCDACSQASSWLLQASKGGGIFDAFTGRDLTEYYTRPF
jgi:hypothetical protein